MSSVCVIYDASELLLHQAIEDSVSMVVKGVHATHSRVDIIDLNSLRCKDPEHVMCKTAQDSIDNAWSLILVCSADLDGNESLTMKEFFSLEWNGKKNIPVGGMTLRLPSGKLRLGHTKFNEWCNKSGMYLCKEVSCIFSKTRKGWDDTCFAVGEYIGFKANNNNCGKNG